MKKSDVLVFGFNLESNLFQLHRDLSAQTYHHGPYQTFLVRDPKLRRIHKASVRDQVVHQALFRVLYYFFDRYFICDSYSCRFNKGTHHSVNRLELFARRVSLNWRAPAYVLQCDIRRFFDNIDQARLLEMLGKIINDEKVLWLTRLIVGSFETSPGKGLPLGNVTSQLFANIYLNELDQFAKHELKAKYYLRYCDDFVILNRDRQWLFAMISPLDNFLRQLGLALHPQKITIRKIRQGIDWLGYVVLPYYRVLRTKTKRRILRKFYREEINERNLSSYLGLLSHCRNYKLQRSLITPGYAKIFRR